MSQTPSYTKSMDHLVDQLAKLPSIGRRTAERMAFHLLKSSKADVQQLVDAMTNLKATVRHCQYCYNLTEADPCGLCCDASRDRRQILVVEQPRDVIQLEQASDYGGVYHVLLGHVAPLEGVDASSLTIAGLMDRVTALLAETSSDVVGSNNSHGEAGDIGEGIVGDVGDAGGGGGSGVELILGTNPTTQGDGTAMYIAQLFAPIKGVTVSRLARGLPVGTPLEYANKAVLSSAIHARHRLS